ncbi:PhnD/SsuA/transferrin family substrate-binding protein [Sutterella sp.]|uniref:sensor histidine kinase n=1 Tax=Sutterella sp. TaxID=1981025 RepID=UPI0026DFDAB2|nr:PhnD/SsuA/transferrin family substrate-binding protein [Sutterella sp.]MDO5532377.1 PhnD/SsuA/transferrin family substrate-binding protein [Sutterella sp.]
MRRTAILLIPCWVLLCSAFTVSAEELPRTAAKKTVTIGVQSSLDPQFIVGSFGPTIAHLRKRFPDTVFKTQFLRLEDLEAAIEKRSLMFFIAESGVFAYEEARVGARDLAVRTTAMAADPARTVSSTVFVLSSSPVRSISDLKGRSIAAESPESFGGWTVLQGIIANRGHDPEEFFSNTIFTRSEFPDVASIVLAGGADAGVLKSCDLERVMREHAYEPGAFRILEPQPGTQLRCLRSGPLYPDIVFASLPWADSELVKDIIVALLSEPPSREGDAWGVCPDFESVDQLFRTLKVGPYRYLREFDWRVLWENYSEWIFAAAGLLVLLILHVIRTNRLVFIRTAQLRGALRREKALEADARESRQRLSKMERIGVVSQMSSMLTHEVRQPLYALINFAGGLRMYVERRYGADPVVADAASSITEEAERISEIVSRVRNYAKQKEAVRERLSPAGIAEAALRTFAHSTTASGVKVKTVPDASADGVFIEADPLEMELLLLNLLRNGASAMKDCPPGEKRLVLGWHSDGIRLVFEVRDHGPQLSDEAFERMQTPLSSTKADGLGLGLALCRTIVERLGGHMEFVRKDPGLCAVVSIPLADAETDGEEVEDRKETEKNQ